MSSPEFNAVLADPNGACDRIEALETTLEEALRLLEHEVEEYGADDKISAPVIERLRAVLNRSSR